MSEIRVGEAAMAGVQIILRRPLSVLVWGASMALVVGVSFLLFGSGLFSLISTIAANPNAEPEPRQIVGAVFGMMGFMMIMLFGAGLLGVVIRGAAMRAELEPQVTSWAGMRFGVAELWLLLTSLAFGFVIFAAQFVMGIPLGILTMAAALGAGASITHDSGVAGAMGFLGATFVIRLVGQLVILAVTFWLWLKLCLGVPMSFHLKEFKLFEGWVVSRGHFWKMLQTMLLVGVMLFGIGLVFMMILVAVAAASLSGLFTDPKAFFLQSPAVWVPSLIPLGIAFLVWITVSVGVSSALVWGAVARMWRQINPNLDAANVFV